MRLARDGYQSCGGGRIQPHYDQRPIPGFPISRFLSDGTIHGVLLILGVNHVEVSAMISCNPDFAPSDELSSLEKGPDAL